MSIYSCVGQQHAVSQNGGLAELSSISSRSTLISAGEKNPNKPSLNWLVQYRTKGTFTSLSCSVLKVTFCVLYLGLFSAQKFNLFSQSNKIHMAQHCSITLPEIHTLLAIPHVRYFPVHLNGKVVNVT